MDLLHHRRKGGPGEPESDGPGQWIRRTASKASMSGETSTSNNADLLAHYFASLSSLTARWLPPDQKNDLNGIIYSHKTNQTAKVKIV